MVLVAVVVMVVPAAVVINMVMDLVVLVVGVVVTYCSTSIVHGIMLYFLCTSTVQPVVNRI
jgi:hypothetical protein